jgi:hypothetical protein
MIGRRIDRGSYNIGEGKEAERHYWIHWYRKDF